MSMNEPTIKVLNPNDPTADPNPYVQIIDEDDDPYMIDDFVRIVAKDASGKDISNNVVYDSSAVDFTKSGDYPVEASVMDDDFNMVSTTFIIHMLDEQEVKIVEAGRSLHRETRKEREEKAIRREKIVDGIAYTVVAFAIICFVIFTYLDAF